MSYQPAYRPAASTSTLAVVSLVFGILSWCLLPFIGAIVAVICGHLARSEIRRAPAGTVIEGDGMAIAGLVLGYIHLAIAIIAVVVLMLLFGAMFLHLGPHWHVFS
ncbi:DUF4190 domain-containing protein [Rhodanobacter koreensis]